MELTKKAFEGFRLAIGMISGNSQRKLAELMDEHGIGSKDFRGTSTMTLAANGMASALLSSVFYGELRELALGSNPDNFVAQPYEVEDAQVLRYVDGALSEDGDDAARRAAMMSLADTFIKNCARRTTEKNCHADRLSKGFQIVPSGVHTCSFCTTQASRGLIYHHDLNDMSQPYHPHCNCQPIPVWDKLPSWFDAKNYTDKYEAAREAWERGDYSGELKERIAANKEAKGKEYTQTNEIMAVMREQNEGMK